MHLKIFAVLVVAALTAAQRKYYSLEDMPETNFDCRDKILGGYYADPEANCQMFHVCVKIPGQGVQDFRFLCPNETAFDQENQICADSGDIDCETTGLYLENFDLYRLGSSQAKRPVPQIGGNKVAAIPLGPSTKSPILTNNVYEDDDYYLQKSETGDRRLHSKDLLRGSSSSNFFNNRNKGKDLEEDDEEPQTKRPDNFNQNQFRPRPNAALRPKTQYQSQFRKAQETQAPTTTTQEPVGGNQNQLNDKKRTKIAVRKLTRKRPEDEVDGRQNQQSSQQQQQQQQQQSNFPTQGTQKFGDNSRYNTVSRPTTTQSSFGTSESFNQQSQQQQQQGRFQNFKRVEQTTPAFFEPSSTASSAPKASESTPFSLLRNPIVAAGPGYNANQNRASTGFQQSRQTTANYSQQSLNGNYPTQAPTINYQNQQQQAQGQQQNRQSNAGSTGFQQQQQQYQSRQSNFGTNNIQQQNQQQQSQQQSRQNNAGATGFQQQQYQNRQSNFGSNNPQQQGQQQQSQQQNRQNNSGSTGFPQQQQQQSRQTTGAAGFSQQRQVNFQQNQQQSQNTANTGNYQQTRQQFNANSNTNAGNFQSQQNQQQSAVTSANFQQQGRQTSVRNGNFNSNQQSKQLQQTSQTAAGNFQQQSRQQTITGNNFQQQTRQQSSGSTGNFQQQQQQQQQNRQGVTGAVTQTRTQAGQQTYNANSQQGFNNQQNFNGQQTYNGQQGFVTNNQQTTFNSQQQTFNNQVNRQRQSFRTYEDFDEGDNQEFLKTAPSNNYRPSDLNSFTNAYKTETRTGNVNYNATKDVSTTKYITPTIVTTPRTTPVYDTPPARQSHPSTSQPSNYYTPTVSTTARLHHQQAVTTTAAPSSPALPQRIYPSPTPAKAAEAKDTAYDYAYYDDAGATFPDYGSFDALGDSDFSRTSQRTKSRLI